MQTFWHIYVIMCSDFMVIVDPWLCYYCGYFTDADAVNPNCIKTLLTNGVHKI